MKITHKNLLVAMLLTLVYLTSCESQKKVRSVSFSKPTAGSIVPQGEQLEMKLDIPEGESVDSIQFLIDGVPVGTVKDQPLFNYDTSSLPFGSKLLVAKYFQNGEMKEARSNVLVVPAKAPVQYAFSVVNTFPHDPNAYTQGLEYYKGVFYESTGLLGKSSLRKVDLNTGKVLKQIELAPNEFGEGLTLMDGKIIQLTWENGYGMVYDQETFTKEKEFSYQASKEGWGIAYDGEKLIKSDGTNRLYFLDKNTFRETGYIEVYSNSGPVISLNELEYINGKIYANVYMTDKIIIINPETGEVEAEINLIGLLPQSHHTPETDWLNGIAYDKQNDRLFVTGKNWDTLFEIKLLDR